MLPIHFAPLQGYTEDCYRRIHHDVCGGVDCYYTPFMRLEHGRVRSKDLRDVNPENNLGVPIVPQVIVRDGTELDMLIATLIPMGYRRIDLNMGCPFPLQTNHGRGAGLMVKPEEVRGICDRIAQHEELQFSVKMRIGLNQKEEWKNILPMLNDTPLTHITLHPRLASQGYKGEVDSEAFAAFAEASRHPLIYNGDIHGINDIHRIEQAYPGLHGIMIGRGLLARPTLAAEYKERKVLTDRELVERIKRMHELLAEAYSRFIPGESQQLMKLRTFWDYLEPTIWRKPWKKIHKAGNMRNYLAAVADLRIYQQ